MNLTFCLFRSWFVQNPFFIGWRTIISWKNPPKYVLHYFSLDCGMLEFVKYSSYKPESKEQLLTLPHFWSPVRWKRSRLVPIQPVCQISRRIRRIFVWSGSELWSLFKYSKLNLKNLSPIAVDDIFKAYQMVPLSCRSILAGRYL